ncbi:AI-2E family transporter [Methylobacterium mesophilicum SR1.6/6]|uniref:AI-2E family transporter n=1 Tax=Methylobacterium mesophilicum SR1.6/6 TaxID=908290 RepID=A0A6B9FMT4_9HYPH|nr:AI-2E family transporter [Methylobacterium mesophilicum SR1.6/6]
MFETPHPVLVERNSGAPPGRIIGQDDRDSRVPGRDREDARATVVEAAIRIGLAAALVYACGRIIFPLHEVLIWSAILSVMLYPLHARLLSRIGDRWSALLIGFVGGTIITVPTIAVVTSAGSTIYTFLSDVQNQTLALPPPPNWVARAPLVGPRLAEAWALAAANAPLALARYGSMLKRPVAWLLSAVRGLATSEISFVLSFAIAAVVIAYGESAAKFSRTFLSRTTGNEARGSQLAALIVATIRSVALGIVGVAVIQALLLGAGFFAIGLPAAGLLTLATFFLCIVQVPALLLTLPIIAYVFATEATRPAVIFLAWTIGAGLSDNILKPFLLGRGMQVPMPVILTGVIGGLIAHGLLGLFVGPVLLATGYVLLVEWIRRDEINAGMPP